MWRIWLMVDPRRGMIAVFAFAFFMVLLNHFVQLSTPRYGSWLNSEPYGAAAAVQQTKDEEVLLAQE
ncbi:MAG: light-harvesting antenna LH1, alpha subunit [Woeseiaceae bacterium]|nr:light-harvesting antenna LH1, alpha subunit [Woeseiaceae bacterium]